MSEMKAAIIMGSTSDLPKVEPAVGILKDYGVEVKVRCLSAHRAHEGLSSFINECNEDGTEVIITAAGMAAALPGVVASQTVLPVIGVPLSGSVLDGMDALMSIVQMPSGIPGLPPLRSTVPRMPHIWHCRSWQSVMRMSVQSLRQSARRWKKTP